LQQTLLQAVAGIAAAMVTLIVGGTFCMSWNARGQSRARLSGGYAGMQ